MAFVLKFKLRMMVKLLGRYLVNIVGRYIGHGNSHGIYIYEFLPAIRYILRLLYTSGD